VDGGSAPPRTYTSATGLRHRRRTAVAGRTGVQ